MDKTGLEIATPITLPCGLTLPNRLVKAALAEGWSDKDKLPSEGLIRTYGTWADGGWGMVLTGNVQVDVAYLGTAEDNAFNDRIPRDRLLASWKDWAQATNRHGTPTLMQINHPGRQSMIGAGTRGVFAKSIAPSPIPLQLGDGILPRAVSALVFGTPREMTVADIQGVVSRFAETAKLAHEAGFAGVQIHAAHGYLLAQFLSASSNQRTDAYGGTARNRARVVVEVIRAVRAAVPKGFCVGIKLNSVDHQSPLELQECIEQLEDITAAGVDLLEISGGTYENPTMVLAGNAPTKAASTLAREAFFLDFAKAIREKFTHVPLVVTGGFRTRQGMEAAVREGACDMVGIGRPAVLNASLPKNTVFNAAVDDGDAKVYARSVAVPWIAKKLGMRAIAGGAETTWYQKQMHRMLTSNI
ncbi:NADH oxidase [Tolypocladium paradoxum]|uniref:NADH oxidase n=1 Tax=Tolypocladium paradoxum TaxID=94208 RepID=A0A2S4L581_9HYPO|nr:NADH oxidase [Tolypocladium paradoxum]